MKKWINQILEEYNFSPQYYKWIHKFATEFIKQNRKKDTLIPYVTIRKYLRMSLLTLSHIDNLDKIEWINDYRLNYNIFTWKMFLDDREEYSEQLAKRFAKYINKKIKKGYKFQFYTLIDKLSFTPELDDISYYFRLIGRFKFIDNE